MADKKADLAGPGIGDYNELEKNLPTNYNSLLTVLTRTPVGALSIAWSHSVELKMPGFGGQRSAQHIVITRSVLISDHLSPKKVVFE